MIANMSMNSYDQRLTNSKQTQNPLVYQNFSKSKIMKNLARTLSLFLIFSENYYKFKTRNCVTALCYDRWFTTLKNDKVLIEPTKKPGTYGFAGQKLTMLFQHTFLTKSVLFNFCSTRPPPAIVRPLQVKFEQLIIYKSEIQGIYAKTFCLFYDVHNVFKAICSLMFTMRSDMFTMFPETFTMWTDMFTVWTEMFPMWPETANLVCSF